MPKLSGTRLNPVIKANNDTGFGTNASSFGGRFVNKDGSFNVRKSGVRITERISIYHKLLNMRSLNFALAIVAFYVVINILFTVVYIVLGVNEFQGFIASTPWGKIKELYFFSTETFTTVGYGRLNPVGDAANLVASFEAMLGFLSFAIATGIIYGRFSRPRSHLVFSHNAVIAPYQDKEALMFRVAPYKDGHNLSDVRVQVTASYDIEENGKMNSKFYSLSLERSKIDGLMMNWTIVHPLDENSPLFGLSEEEMKNADMEIYVTIRGFDEVYSNTVLQRTSYTYHEIIHGAKFVMMYHVSPDGNTTIFELDKLNEIVKLGERAKANK